MPNVRGSGRAQQHFAAHVMEPSEGCRDWPYALRDGYGTVVYDGRSWQVHVLTCIVWHGSRPPGMEAAHSCGRSICWAGEHLRWDTHRSNLADRIAHGTIRRGEKNNKAKLTEAQVLEIRARYAVGGITQRELATEYGVSRPAVGYVIRRHTWHWL